MNRHHKTNDHAVSSMTLKQYKNDYLENKKQDNQHIIFNIVTIYQN